MTGPITFWRMTCRLRWHLYSIHFTACRQGLIHTNELPHIITISGRYCFQVVLV